MNKTKELLLKKIKELEYEQEKSESSFETGMRLGHNLAIDTILKIIKDIDNPTEEEIKEFNEIESDPTKPWNYRK